MKQKLAIVLILVLSALGLEIATNTQAPTVIKAPVETVPQNARHIPAPDFSFTALDEKTANLSDFSGKIVILNFWATWCAPCIREFPDLLELAGNYPDETVLLAVSVDESPEKIAPFLNRLGEIAKDRLKSPNVLIATDPERKIVQDLFGTTMFPETFIIGPDRTVRRKIAGVIEWKNQTLQDLAGESRLPE